MKRLLAISILVMSGCSSIDLATVDNFGLCKEHADNQPISTSHRVGLAAATFGFSELGMLFDKSDEELSKVELEMRSRGMTDCSPKGLAQFECSKIFGETVSSEFKSCVMSNTNSIIARIESIKAKKRANAALIESLNDDNSFSNFGY